MNVALEDLLIAARTVYGEARGEPWSGKLAVAHVLVNRWKNHHGQWKKDDTLASTCLRHLQFSAWNARDPNFGKVQTVAFDDKTFRECLACVLWAIDGENDPTSGALHYHTVKAPSSTIEWPPSWAASATASVTIGNHVFHAGIP